MAADGHVVVKRRRDETAAVAVAVAPPEAAPATGPFLLPLPETLRERFLDRTRVFKAYRKREHDQAPRDRALMADLGTTVAIATNYGEAATVASRLANYALGVYDAQKATLTLVDAEVLALRTDVKALQGITSPAKPEQTYAERRNLLGETFGTKKVKQAIRAIERNQIDVTTLKPIAGLIEDTIITKAEEIPSMEEMTAEMQLDRPIPPFNAEAESASDVYSMDDIITPEEMTELNVKPWLKLTADTLAELRESRRYPEFVLRHLEAMADAPKKDKRRLKQLLYLTYLTRLWFLRHFDDDDQVASMIGTDAPKSVLARFYSLFVDSQEDVKTGGTRRVMTPRNKDLLASYILVLCLFLERDLTLDPLAIAPDLKIERTKVVEKLRNLGCTLVYLVNKDGVKVEASGTDAGADEGGASAPGTPSGARAKYLRLQLPLQFPRPKRPLRR